MIGRRVKRHVIRSRAFGLTLIELVVALVLASMMMVALLRIVSLVAIETNQLRSEQTDFAAAGILADRLERDLGNARGILAGADSITLAGFLTGQSIPGMVRYESTSIDGRRVLIRRAGNRTELCWVGFGSFLFEAYDDVDGETPGAEMAGDLPPMPARFRIGVSDQRGQLLFSEVVEHHAE